MYKKIVVKFFISYIYISTGTTIKEVKSNQAKNQKQLFFFFNQVNFILKKR